jgi:hypothetical protein
VKYSNRIARIDSDNNIQISLSSKHPRRVCLFPCKIQLNVLQPIVLATRKTRQIFNECNGTGIKSSIAERRMSRFSLRYNPFRQGSSPPPVPDGARLVPRVREDIKASVEDARNERNESSFRHSLLFPFLAACLPPPHTPRPFPSTLLIDNPRVLIRIPIFRFNTAFPARARPLPILAPATFQQRFLQESSPSLRPPPWLAPSCPIISVPGSLNRNFQIESA